jgi:hypothetical protein
MEENESNKRTRMNASLTAKGFVQWDITAEYDTPELTAEMLGKAIDLERKVLKDKGLEEVKATDK